MSHVVTPTPARPRPKSSWAAIAVSLARAIPRTRLDRSVVAWAEAHARARATWAIGLSGGADSVALLLLLWAHWPEQRRRLRALHFDHRLRGADSGADAKFCRKLCAALRVPYVVERWSRPAGAPAPSEAEAREARLAFLHRHARVLWLGHHQDDVAETMLMRLARGSGAGGLSAPRPVQVVAGRFTHLRPLLGLRKQELVQHLSSAGARWRHDVTNDHGDYFRNRIRRDVLPAWEAAAERDAVAGAARARELLAEDDAALDAWVDALKVIGASGDLLLKRLAGKPRAVCRRALHRWLLANGPGFSLSRQAFDALLDSVERGAPTRHSIGANVFAVLRQGRLRCEFRKPQDKFQRCVN